MSRETRQQAMADLLTARTRLAEQISALQLMVSTNNIPALWTVPGAANEMAEHARALLDDAAQQLTILSLTGAFLCPQESTEP